MEPVKHSQIFNLTISIWKILGLWSDKSSSKWFRLYSFLCATVITFGYILFYTLSLLYTPLTVEIFVSEAIYYFVTFSGIIRVVTILIKHQQLISNLEIMDCQEFRECDGKTKEYIRQFENGYNGYLKVYAINCSGSACTFILILPLLNHLLRQEELKLPICGNYFLSDDHRNKYFLYWYLYQTAGMVGAITFNITSHTFICGLIYMAITQFKILNYNIANILINDDDIPINMEAKERIYLNKLYKCLRHYEILLEYCQSVQNITSVMIFAQFGLAALTICFCMCMFFLPLTQKELVFMGFFTAIILLDSFVPSLLGSQLTYESNNLRFAAYSSDWYSRSKPFKSSLMLLVERARRPVVLTGLQMVPLSLETFASILKTAYSFFTILSDKSSSKWFRLYSYIFVTVISFGYLFFYTLSLLYTPRTVRIFVTEAIYYFITFSGIIRVVAIWRKHPQLISNFIIMDCKEFRENDGKTNEYIRQFQNDYKRYFRVYAINCSGTAYTFILVIPLLNHFFRQEELKLPICGNYFLTDDHRNKYFLYWYLYQIAGLVGTVTNNITSHTLICGLNYMAITQFRILNYNIANIMLDDDDVPKNMEAKERIYLNKLFKCLRHYEIILEYCQSIQNITSLMIFAQFGLAALTLCLCMYMFLMPLSEKDLVLMGCYTTVMVLDSFVPSLLGSQLTFESNNLRFSAFSSDWYSRSKPFKASLMLLLERARRPVVITGLKMVPLSLETFASIIRTAYSFFTLLRGAQDQSRK
ncbi:hypothetical protein ABMA28_007158 [Loxostege sticticalis]|uniref:Odorant receptor n=1 Tax=Loxostege sticticalis TaxID=481309 RepID=A0ABD0TPP1_LOXSC